MAQSSRRRSVEAVLQSFRTLNRAVARQNWSEWARLDLSMAQLKAVFVLGDAGALTLGALAARVGTKPSATSILVDRLVHAGLVRRQEDAGDRRRVLLSPTPDAEALIGRLRQGTAHLRRRLERLTPAELEGLDRGLAALTRAVEDGEAGATR